MDRVVSKSHVRVTSLCLVVIKRDSASFFWAFYPASASVPAIVHCYADDPGIPDMDPEGLVPAGRAHQPASAPDCEAPPGREPEVARTAPAPSSLPSWGSSAATLQNLGRARRSPRRHRLRASCSMSSHPSQGTCASREFSVPVSV